MPLPETGFEDLVAHLRALGLRKGDDVVVHGHLVAFGRIEGGEATLDEALRAVIGDAATIAVPTYTFRCDPEAPFDPQATPSQGMGVFSEHFRRQPQVRRSWCPLHSHAAKGPKASLLREDLCTASFGPGSDFEAFHEAGFRLLTLGCDFLKGASYVHHVEAVARVPYREWRELPRRIVLEDGRLAEGRCRYYLRKDRSVVENFSVVGAALESAGRLRRARCPLGSSTLCDLAAVHETTLKLLRADPYAVVTSPQ